MLSGLKYSLNPARKVSIALSFHRLHLGDVAEALLESLHDDAHAGAEGAFDHDRVAGLDGRPFGPQLLHVAENRDTPPAAAQLDRSERRERRGHGRRIGVVALIDQE